MRHITKFTDDAKKKLRRIPQKQSKRILDKLTELQQAMDKGDLGNLDVKRADGTLITWIWVIDVGPRENFYG